MTTTPTTPEADPAAKPTRAAWTAWAKREVCAFNRQQRAHIKITQSPQPEIAALPTTPKPITDLETDPYAPCWADWSKRAARTFIRRQLMERQSTNQPQPGDSAMPIATSTPTPNADSAKAETGSVQGVQGRNLNPDPMGDTRASPQNLNQGESAHDAIAQTKIGPGRHGNAPGKKRMQKSPAEAAGRSPRLCWYPEVILAGVKKHYRAMIHAEFRRLGGNPGKLNDRTRHLLSEAIYKVEDVLEYKDSNDPQVKAMRQVRNWLYDDIGVNTYPPWKVITDLPPAGAPKPIRPHNRKAAVELKPADPIDTTDQTGATP